MFVAWPGNDSNTHVQNRKWWRDKVRGVHPKTFCCGCIFAHTYPVKCTMKPQIFSKAISRIRIKTFGIATRIKIDQKAISTHAARPLTLVLVIHSLFVYLVLFLRYDVHSAIRNILTKSYHFLSGRTERATYIFLLPVQVSIAIA